MGEAIDYSITDHLVTNHFLVSLLITDHPTSLFELRGASWLLTYAEAPAGKLVNFSYFIPRHSSLPIYDQSPIDIDSTPSYSDSKMFIRTSGY
jgi:hypothetical protein